MPMSEYLTKIATGEIPTNGNSASTNSNYIPGIAPPTAPAASYYPDQWWGQQHQQPPPPQQQQMVAAVGAPVQGQDEVVAWEGDPPPATAWPEPKPEAWSAAMAEATAAQEVDPWDEPVPEWQIEPEDEEPPDESEVIPLQQRMVPVSVNTAVPPPPVPSQMKDNPAAHGVGPVGGAGDDMDMCSDNETEQDHQHQQTLSIQDRLKSLAGVANVPLPSGPPPARFRAPPPSRDGNNHHHSFSDNHMMNQRPPFRGPSSSQNHHGGGPRPLMAGPPIGPPSGFNSGGGGGGPPSRGGFSNHRGRGGFRGNQRGQGPRW